MTISYPGHDDVQLVYPTPVLVRQFPDTQALNRALERIILRRERSDGGEVKSNVGGWHSEPVLFGWPYPEIDQLKRWVGAAVKSMTQFTAGVDQASGELDAWAWANVCRHGHYHKPHTHTGASWSGVYYVNAGTDAADDPNSGLIEFIDPRCGVDMLETPGRPFADKFILSPESGTMLLFPSWLYHHVNPYHGEGVRISIAFNVRFVASSLAAG